MCAKRQSYGKLVDLIRSKLKENKQRKLSSSCKTQNASKSAVISEQPTPSTVLNKQIGKKVCIQGNQSSDNHKEEEKKYLVSV